MSNAPASRFEHIEHDKISHAASEHRVTSLEAEDVVHGPAGPNSGRICHECGANLKTQILLINHADATKHEVQKCKCGKRFRRPGDLSRHLEEFDSKNAKFPCSHCRRHRGGEAFKRKDHLTQHLRTYHHIDVKARELYSYTHRHCPYSECPEYRDNVIIPGVSWSEWYEQLPLKGQVAYTKHMREVHNESPFPCDVAHCPKIGERGISGSWIC